jgi:hypothetical protein
MEVIGLAAVVGSLLLVSFQIQQANRIAQATTLYEIVRDINEFNDMVLGDSAFVDLLITLSDEQNDLSETELRQAQALADRFLNIWVIQETAHRNGLFTDDQLEITKTSVLNAMDEYPGLRPFLSETMRVQPEFSEYEVLQPLLE